MAKEKFYLEKTAEEFEQHESMKVKAQKKQVIQLDNCLELFTKSEQLGENDLWSVLTHGLLCDPNWYQEINLRNEFLFL